MRRACRGRYGEVIENAIFVAVLRHRPQCGTTAAVARKDNRQLHAEIDAALSPQEASPIESKAARTSSRVAKRDWPFPS